MKKTLTQKLNQLRDYFSGSDLKELQKDILDLKLSNDDKFYLTLKDKYEIQ